MLQRDLQVIKEYFEGLKSDQTKCSSEIQSIIMLIETISKECSSTIHPSVTLARKDTVNCNICKKRVIPDG